MQTFNVMSPVFVHCFACAESSEEVTPPVSRAEKHLARQSLRRARQREVEQKRNMEESKMISDSQCSV